MTTLEKTPLRIPDTWSATWFRTFVVEVLAKADVRNATGEGLVVSTAPSGKAVLSVTEGNAEAIAVHDGEPFAHANAFAAHTANADPHPGYPLRSESESLSFFLGE